MPQYSKPPLMDIVHDIYGAAVESTLWPGVLRKVAATVGADAGSVWIHDFEAGSATLDGSGPNMAAFVGLEPARLESYAAHYSRVNVWSADEERLPAGSAVTSSMLFPDARLKKTEFYADWLRGQDLFFSLGGVVEKHGTRAVKMSFLRPERAGAYDEDSLAVIQMLMPHLQAAVGIHRRLHHLQGINDSLLLALDALSFGVLLLGPRGQVRHANRLAQRIAHRTRAFSLGASGRLQASTHALSARLQAAIDKAVLAGAGLCESPGSVVRLRAAQGADVQAFIVSMPPAAGRFPSHVAALMFVNDPESTLPTFAERLQHMYLLTPAEAQLATALVAGKSLKEFAEERGTSMNTVKSQLKALAAKVGAKRQVDVVRCILTGPAVLDL